MTTEEIEKIKKDGAKRELFDYIHSNLWSIKNLTEYASANNYKNFEIAMENAIGLIGNAQQLYEEVKKL